MMILVYDLKTGIIKYSIEENLINIIFDSEDKVLKINEFIDISKYYIKNGILKEKYKINYTFENNLFSFKVMSDEKIDKINLKIISNNKILNKFEIDLKDNGENMLIEKKDYEKYVLVFDDYFVIPTEVVL